MIEQSKRLGENAMQILIIRHGQSEADLLKVHEGRADFLLTECGIQQAHHMADWVKTRFKPEIIWSSPLMRAKQTANILSDTVGCKVTYDSDLMEWNNGVLAGMSKEEAKKKYPEPINGHRPHESVEKGESAIAFRMRAEIMLAKIQSVSEKYNCLAIVSHGGMIARILHSFMELPVNNKYVIKTSDTGIHLLEYRVEKRVIHFFNQTSHL